MNKRLNLIFPAKKNVAFTLKDRNRLNAYCERKGKSANQIIREIVAAKLDQEDARQKSKKLKK